MASKRDYYEVLGVSKDVDEKQLKSAFRSLARKFHPDKNDSPDADDKFKEIQEAYAVLSDSQKRQQYDRFGHEPPGGSPFGAGGFQGFNINLEDIMGGDLGDIFSSFFGGSRSSRSSRRRGDDILVRQTVSLADVISGASKEINLDLPSECETCDGSGSKDGESKTCGKCKGNGRVRVRQQIGPFVQEVVQECSSCSGVGRVIETPCSKCRGDGISHKEQKLRFNVPIGADHGTRLRNRGIGSPAPYGNGTRGDLLIEIQVEQHPWLERNGRDLIMSLPLGYSDLVLGCEHVVDHVDDEDLKIKIPAGSNSGDTIEIRGRGIPDSRGRRGDVVVLLKLHVPKLSKSTKKALQEMSSELCGNEDMIDLMRKDATERRRG